MPHFRTPSIITGTAMIVAMAAPATASIAASAQSSAAQSMQLAQTEQRGSSNGTAQRPNPGPRVQQPPAPDSNAGTQGPRNQPRDTPDDQRAGPRGCPYNDRELNLMV